jgi:hypothetical protein
VGTVIATGAAIIGIEGYGASVYRQTPRGQEEERKAREEGAVIYKHAREAVLRPGVLGGLVGLGERLSLSRPCICSHLPVPTANIGILGGVAYTAYDNWNRPWDRRYVSAVTVGLLALWGGEG